MRESSVLSENFGKKVIMSVLNAHLYQKVTGGEDISEIDLIYKDNLLESDSIYNPNKISCVGKISMLIKT